MAIKITTSELTSAAAQIRSYNDSLRDDLNQIYTAMQSLDATWQSDAGRDIRAAMDSHRDRFFQQYYNVIDSYAQFLDRSASNYEQVETSIQSNANAFKNR